MKEETPKVKEVYVKIEDEEEDSEPQYVGKTLIVCGVAVLVLILLILLIEFLVGWGPVFVKICDMLGV